MSRNPIEWKSASSRRGPLLRAFRIGPGLLLAILAAVLIGVLQRPNQPAPGGKPGYPRSGWIEHVPRVSQRPATPDLSQLLALADALRLTLRQRAAIERLMKQWGPESAERRRDMDRAAAEFTQFMQEAQRRGQGGLEEIQRHATETSALTTEWLARKAHFWQQGLAELTPAQRLRATSLIQRPVRQLRPSGKGEER